MGSMHSARRWRHAAADRRKPCRELACYIASTRSSSFKQVSVAGGGLIAFQHFTWRQRQVSMTTGENSSKCWNYAHAGTQFRQTVFCRSHNAVNGNFIFAPVPDH
ncbi:hypothetical protein KCP75_02295 [Salmonella enterica subsp. enterica]|nr:hypothetical protein KCP75_02295 [Salmonella enterica subsp. enterica]